jgi:AraC-like DNA-binding protein
MVEPTILLDAPGVRVGEVSCDVHHDRWSDEEPICTFAIILMRRGSFERRIDGARHLADGVTAYLQRPGSVQRIAHRSAGDLTTVIAPEARTLGDLAERALALDDMRLSPVADLHHRLLIARARAGAEQFELTERSVVLAGSLIACALDDGRSSRSRKVSRRESTLVDDVRDSITSDVSVRLDALAEVVDVPAYQLSRTFRRVTGETVTRYRLRLRLNRALARMAAGEGDLAGVAVDSGFADQAHLTRALRQETGWTPGAVRSQLTASV